VNPQNFSTIHLSSHRPVSAPSRPIGIGGVPAYRQAGRGPIKTIFPFQTFCSPLRAREAPACLSRPNGMAGELHNFVRKEQTCRIAQAIYHFSNRFLTIFKSAKPPKIIRKIINKFEKAKSLVSRPIPHSP
jgi:hypothetical protein